MPRPAVETRRICIATGQLAETLDTTEKIKGIPGGLATGTNLISFDKDSFCSFGLEQAQNAALSAPAELKIRSALNALIDKSRGQGLVFNNTVHLHWTREPIQEDPFDLLASADKNAVEALLKSIQQGQPPVAFEANAYYALSLSGNGARIVVRDWLESTVPEVQRHVAEWFQDLAIVQPDGQGTKRDFKFGALLYGMVRADLEDLLPGPADPTFAWRSARALRSFAPGCAGRRPSPPVTSSRKAKMPNSMPPACPPRPHQGVPAPLTQFTK